jgi:hypothetical protein
VRLAEGLTCDGTEARQCLLSKWRLAAPAEGLTCDGVFLRLAEGLDDSDSELGMLV